MEIASATQVMNLAIYRQPKRRPLKGSGEAGLGPLGPEVPTWAYWFALGCRATDFPSLWGVLDLTPKGRRQGDGREECGRGRGAEGCSRGEDGWGCRHELR
jgi:hypothetical protein